MKIKGEFEIISIGDEVMAVPVGDSEENIHGIIRLNESAKEIFELLKEDFSEEELIEKLTAKYDNEKEEIVSYVKDILKSFSDMGIM